MLKQKGAVLFICIWALVTLSILSLGVAGRVNSEMQFARYLRDSVVSYYSAKAALNLALSELKNDPTPNSYAFFELQKKQDVQLVTGSFSFNFSDEEGRININSADAAKLERLPGLDSGLAKEIVDSGLRPFAAKEELMLVSGVTKEIFLQLKDLITVYGSGVVNINTASEEVLQVLGLSGDTIETILDYRLGEDGEAFTDDDAVYDFVPPYVTANLFGTTSNYLRLNITAGVLGKSTRDYSIVFEVSSGRILSWQEA